MIIRQFVAEGLGNCSYLNGGQEAGVRAVIDPERDVEPYISAAKLGVRITHALETHVHADFVSGAREFAAIRAQRHCHSMTRNCENVGEELRP